MAVLTLVVALLPASGVTSGAEASDVVTSVHSGTLANRGMAAHVVEIGGGRVQATLAFADRRERGTLEIFDDSGRRLFRERSRGDVSFSGRLPQGTYRWVVTAFSALSYRLEATATAVGASEGSTKPEDAAPIPDPLPVADPEGPVSPAPDPVAVAVPDALPSNYTVFHLDAVDGRDANDGRSPATAWRTLAGASARSLPDRSALLLRGGQTFNGTLNLGSDDGGTALEPLVIGSYGEGRATIEAGRARAISVYNRGAITLQDLQLRGDFADTSDGIVVYSDLPGGVLLDGVNMQRIEASGFRGWGIALGSWAGGSGFKNVLFEELNLHGNGNGGLLTYAQEPNVHQNVRILESRAHANPGYPGAPGHTGNGFVLGSVNGGEISRSLAYRNGGSNDVDAEGPVGIWTYNSDRVVIQFNESFDNRSGSRADGGGFDLDNGTTNSLLQYNYSHGNDGAGFLLWQTGAVPSSGNVVRYNISENDGRKNGYGGITVGGNSQGSLVHHNTVFTGKGSGAMPAAVALFERASGYRFRNNALIVERGMPVVWGAEGALDVTFRGNAYHSGGGAFHVDWGRTRYDDVASWRSATGQEREQSSEVGMFVDPQLTAAGLGGTIGDTTRLAGLHAYLLQPTSPLRGTALPMTEAQRGSRDFFGSAVPSSRAADIGAHQAS